MKNILKGLVFMVVGLFISINLVAAQTTSPKQVESVLVATVNIYGATNTKINNYTYSVSFRLNNRTGIQPNIRYGIQLVRKSDDKAVDMNLANESVTLGEGEEKNIKMEYTIPTFIPDGVYKLMVVAQNEKGIPLGYVPAGFPERLINIENSNAGANIDSCYLTVEGDASTTAKYNISQGVDIRPSEKLNAVCELSNSNSVAINNLRLQLITHNRDQFGDIVSNNTLDQNMSVKGNSKQTVSFTIPTQTAPQAYDIDTFLVNNTGQKVSGSIFIHYVIAGNSATLQNTILDKTSYKKGEVANLKVFWTAAADSFPMSRLGGTKDTYTINSKITNSSGEACGSASKQANAPQVMGETMLKISIEKDCSPAIAVVSILDSKGNVLDETKIDINNPTSSVNINANVPYAGRILTNLNKTYVLIFLIVLALIAYGIMKLKKDKPNMVENK